MTRKENPRSPRAKIRVEKRAGKAVVVIAGLHTYGARWLDDIARELKSALGTGGTVKNGTIEIQGDKVEAIKSWFVNRPE
jgi:translation initiation factor 1